jgi:hypothetical protein
MARKQYEQGLFVASHHQNELIREAQQNRLGHTRPDGTKLPGLLEGFRLRLAAIGALFGRAASGNEEPCDAPCPDAA